jgi:hypothetical protein
VDELVSRTVLIPVSSQRGTDYSVPNAAAPTWKQAADERAKFVSPSDPAAHERRFSPFRNRSALLPKS